MTANVYNLTLDGVLIDKKNEFEVIFQQNDLKLRTGMYRVGDKPTNFSWHYRRQTVTTCIIRNGVEVLGIGSAIQNPADRTDDEMGMKTAFKRAIEQVAIFAEIADYLNSDLDAQGYRHILHAFRKAYRAARNPEPEPEVETIIIDTNSGEHTVEF